MITKMTRSRKMAMSTKIEEDLMNVLREHSKREHTYINPNFLQDVVESLCSYYNLEDDDVDKWVRRMWSA